jgi:hypothetical protein
MVPADPETQLAAVLSEYARAGPWEHRHPVVTLRVAALLRRLPVRTCRLSRSRDGLLIAHYLDKRTLGLSTPLHQAVTCLDLPEVPGTYDEGPERATQRRHARKAIKAGVTWTRVSDPAEREQFVALTEEKARLDLQGDFEPEVVNFPSMLETDHWLAAWLDGEPLLLAVTAVDGEWAMLRYFGSYGSSPVASSTRYLMTGVLAEDLAARGVRQLVDNKSALRMPPGVRHFSRMVGFRTRRVRVA